MTIGEWIDGGDRPVPEAFRNHLGAEDPVSVDTLLDAAASKLSASGDGASRDRASAFALLAADAYITYACLWTVTEGDTGDLRRIAERIVHAWPPGRTV